MAAVLACGPGAVLSRSARPISGARGSGRAGGHRRRSGRCRRRTRSASTRLALLERTRDDYRGGNSRDLDRAAAARTWRRGSTTRQLERHARRRRSAAAGCVGRELIASLIERAPRRPGASGACGRIAADVDPRAVDALGLRRRSISSRSAGKPSYRHLRSTSWWRDISSTLLWRGRAGDLVETDSYAFHADRPRLRARSPERTSSSRPPATASIVPPPVCSIASRSRSWRSSAARSAPDAHRFRGATCLANAMRMLQGHAWSGPAEAQCASSEACAGGRDSSASEVISSGPRAASSSTSVASSAERA